jgi:hypothetical protein
MAIGLLIAGCGGGDGGEPLSKADFAQQTNAICTTANKKRTAIDEKFESSTDGPIAALEIEMEGIEDLTPPAADEEQIETMLTDMQNVIDVIESEASRFDLNIANAELEKAEKAAEGSGLGKDCLLS